MFRTILFSFLICLIKCVSYKELEKHGSVKVSQADNRIYFDLSPFEVGELIQFEISMDLSLGDTSQYKFHIKQVEASTYYDQTSWDATLLNEVTNKNVSCEDFDDCIFSWDEIKQEGKKYIYINLPPPYSSFFTTFDEKIKIKHLGGLSDGAIAGIVLGCLAFVGIIAAIIGCCCCRHNPRCYTCCYRCCPSCHCCLCCCRSSQYGIGIGSTLHVQVPPAVIPAPVPVPAVIPDPYYPQPAYAPAVPYSSGGFI
jgi:hypothetical protein